MGFLKLAAIATVALIVLGCSSNMIRLPSTTVADEWLQIGGSPAGGAYRVGGPEPPLHLQWQQRMDGAPLGGSRLSGGIVLTLTKKSTLYAFDRHSGQLVDRSALDELACSPPLITSGNSHLLILSELGRRPKMSAFARRGGERLWEANGISCMAAVAAGDTVYVPFEHGLTAFSAEDGSQLWHWTGEGRFVSAPTVSGHLVLLGGSDGVLTAVSAADGQTLWQVKMDAGVRTRPLATESRVYAASASGLVYGLDSNGTEMWRTQLGGLLSPGFALNDHVLAAGCVDGTIYGLNPASGGILWEFETEGIVRSAPVATATTIYGASNDGSIYALDAKRGAVLWSYALDVPIVEPLIIGAGQLIVAAESGELYAFGR